MEQLDILTSFGALIKNDKNMGILTKAKTNKNNDFNAKLNNQLHKQNDNVSSINNRDKAVKDKMTVGDNELVHAKELDVEGTEKYQNVNSEDKNVSERQEIVSQEAVAREDVFPAVIPSVTGNIPITTAFFDADVVAENIILPIVTAETSISDGGTANGFFTDLEATLAQSVLKTDVPVVMADNEQSSEMFMNVKNAEVPVIKETAAADFAGSKLAEQVNDDVSKTPGANKNVLHAKENGLRYEVYGEERSAEEKTQVVSKDFEVKKIMDIEARRGELQRLREQNNSTGKNDVFSNSKPLPESDNRNLLFAQHLDSRLNMESANRSALTNASVTHEPEIFPNDLFDQMVKKFDVMVKQNLSEIRLQLHPEYLGKMVIKVVMEEGALIAKFYTENHQVKTLIENNLALLKQNFEAQGIKVDKTEVNVQVNADSNNNQDARDQQQTGGGQNDNKDNYPPIIDWTQYNWPEDKTEPELLRVYPYEWGGGYDETDADVNMESINYLI